MYVCTYVNPVCIVLLIFILPEGDCKEDRRSSPLAEETERKESSVKIENASVKLRSAKLH